MFTSKVINSYHNTSQIVEKYVPIKPVTKVPKIPKDKPKQNQYLGKNMDFYV